MVNERYDEKGEGHEEGHEEGEYHFSDDQANYDLDVEGASKEGVATVAVSKESLKEKLKNHRRIVIGIVVFIVLLAIVYKLVMPSSTTTPVTDFSQQASSAAKTDTIKSTTTVTTTQTTAPVNPPQAAPVATAPVQPQQPPIVAQQVTPPPAVIPTETQAQPVMPQQPVTSAPVSAPPATMTPPPTMTSTDTNKGALDRIATLEQQNSAMMNLLQTQYVQRITEAEAQNTQLRTQVQELTTRVSSMEVAFRQLTKMLRGARMSSAAPSQPMRVAAPHSIYTVQAIIPGRAWLKSEAGETVTVAEGDVLRGLGRITKIDPYDGIVDIDTGTRVLTLSYGASD